MADIRAKACAYYRDGNLRILHARYEAGRAVRPHEVVAHVVGHRSTYVVTLVDGVWFCTCHGTGDGCRHIATVQLATGWPSAAAKPQKTRRAA